MSHFELPCGVQQRRRRRTRLGSGAVADSAGHTSVDVFTLASQTEAMQTIVAVPPDTQGYEELIERAMEKQKAHVNSVFERSRVDNEKAEREPTVEALQSSIEALKSQLSVTSLFGIKNEAATEAEGCHLSPAGQACPPTPLASCCLFWRQATPPTWRGLRACAKRGAQRPASPHSKLSASWTMTTSSQTSVRYQGGLR